MKTSTAILLGAAGLGALWLLARPKAAAQPSAPSSVFSLGGLIGGASSLIGRVFSSASSGPSVAQVKSLDASNIAAYDAQGSPSQPVYGIAGLDY